MRPHAARLSRHGLALWMLLCGSAPAWAADGAGLPSPGSAQPASPSLGATGQLLDFDIPAQPLAAALDQYAYLIKQPVVYPGSLAVGRTASAVAGRYTPEVALQSLLQGTGLVMQKLRTPVGDTFTLSEVAARTDLPRAGTTALLGRPRGFHGLVQSRVLQALCAQPDTVPGDYSALLRFRLDGEGRVQGAQLLDATGNPRRDAAILEALRQVRMERPPQALAGQSLTMAVLPRGQDAGPQCTSNAQAG